MDNTFSNTAAGQDTRATFFNDQIDLLSEVCQTIDDIRAVLNQAGFHSPPTAVSDGAGSKPVAEPTPRQIASDQARRALNALRDVQSQVNQIV